MEVDPAFLAFLQDEETRAYDGSLLEEVEAAINSYNGAEYGDEEDGRSQVVSRDVSESVDYMLTSLIDAMVASGRVVEFEPSDEEAEDVADDATEAMHYIYRRKSGYRFIHDWAKSGLLEKIGISKSCVERKVKRVEALYHPAMMPDNAIEAQETEELHEVDGSPLIHAVTLEETAATFPDYQVPLEEFRVAPDARDFDSAVYIAHLPQKLLSELVEMGFDRETVDTLNGDTTPTALAMARYDGRQITGDDRSGALRKVTLCEEYVLYDLNGDGIAERLCVHRVGNTILNIEEVDYQPFEFWCPFPMQGRIVGQSFADKVTDIQRVNTVLERNMLDSLYQQTAPGTFISEDSIGDHTLDDLLTIRPGRVVRFAGMTPPIPEVRGDVSATAMAAIEFKIRQRESRTGITRLNKGVDEDTLNETAKGQAQLMARGQQMERYVIRNFAEGVARLFMKKVGLMRKYAQPFRIRVDGEYKEVDPSQWPEDMEVNVVVGLGSGSKQDRIMFRQLIAQAQTALLMNGSPIVTHENVYNNMVAGAKDMGLAPNDLFTKPEENPLQPKPDPKMMELQAKVQEGQMKLMQAREEAQQKLALMAQQHEADAHIEAAKAEIEAQLAVRQQNLDMQLQAMQMHMEHQKHQHDMQLRESESKAKVKTMRKGGALNK